MVMHAIKMLVLNARVMCPQDVATFSSTKSQGDGIIHQIKELTIQIVCFYYDKAVGKVGSLKKIPQRILKHLGNFVFLEFFLYTLRLQSKAFFLPVIMYCTFLSVSVYQAR